MLIRPLVKRYMITDATPAYLSLVEKAFIMPHRSELMTDTVTFQLWQGSTNVRKGVDVSGIVGNGVSIEAASFYTGEDGLLVNDTYIEGRRADAGFNAVEPGMYPVRVDLTLSDGQAFVLQFYIHVVAVALVPPEDGLLAFNFSDPFGSQYVPLLREGN